MGNIAEGKGKTLHAHGWLEDNDPFFDAIDCIIQDRSMHVPRILGETPAE